MSATIDGLIDYAGLRGTVVTDTPENRQALQRALDYIRVRYVIRQYSATPVDTIMDRDNTVEAVYIAALKEIETPYFWSATYTADEAKILTRAGDISWTPVSGVTSDGTFGLAPMSPLIQALMAHRGYVGGGFVV